MTAKDEIFTHKIVAILRGVLQKDVLNIAKALHTGGIKILEVTLNSPSALTVIKELAAEMNGKMLIGAGTVLNAEEAKAAIAAGARFIISPVFDIDIITTAKQAGVVSIPAAFTPTEIFNAYKNGGDIIKLFPALNIDYMKSVRAPLDNIPLMPTGGIDAENILEFHKAGAVAFGLGSYLVNSKQPVSDAYLENITHKARKLSEALSAV